MRKKFLSPTLYPLSRDLAKTWFVGYNDKNGKPVKLYGKLNHLPTVDERIKESKKIIKKILEPGIAEAQLKTDVVAKLSQSLEYKRPFLENTSYINYFSVIKCFSIWYRKERQINKNVEPREYIRYMFEKNYHKNTIRKRYFTLKELAKDITPNPFYGFKLKKVKAQSKLPFSNADLAKILPIIEKKNPQLRDAIDFAFYLFFRPKEIRFLKIEHLLFDDFKVLATPEITKDDDYIKKVVPIPMRKHFLKYQGLPSDWFVFGQNGQPSPVGLSKNVLTDRCTKILRSNGFGERYTFYSFVHTGIKKAAMSGVPFKQLQLQKGHSDLNMFNEYMKDLGIDDCIELVTNFPSIE